MSMSFAPVHELAVLGALRVLDQEHVPGAGPLQKQSEKPHQRTRAPDHCDFPVALMGRGHAPSPSMSESARRSNLAACGLE